MNALICEMCGSNDIIKQNGCYVCQACGTKYSVEEAKKMIGIVDVSGSTVKVDNSDELSNLYQIARRAKVHNDIESAMKYYEMILIKDPSSWEGNFFSVYFRAIQCKILEIATTGTIMQNCIETTLQLISDNVSNGDERRMAVEEVQQKSYFISNMLVAAAEDYYSKLEESMRNQYVEEYIIMTSAASGIVGVFCNELSEIFADDSAVMFPFGITVLKDRIKGGIVLNWEEKYAAIIRKYEPDYIPPKREKLLPVQTTSDGCYIATCIYWSYDCSQVWTLRRFRDYKLSKTLAGRLFIKTYYATSPHLVNAFGKTSLFQKFWKKVLDSFIKQLIEKGYEDTPYYDR
ncbi:MAG: hypothetical protein HDT43_01795 [Ruminococcaceae bacterium]|nr:hypothetical protein [Oscillospiraceae bacterium]